MKSIYEGFLALFLPSQLPIAWFLLAFMKIYSELNVIPESLEQIVPDVHKPFTTHTTWLTAHPKCSVDIGAVSSVPSSPSFTKSNLGALLKPFPQNIQQSYPFHWASLSELTLCLALYYLFIVTTCLPILSLVYYLSLSTEKLFEDRGKAIYLCYIS